jgi:ketosteroid isomerase-like protein
MTLRIVLMAAFAVAAVVSVEVQVISGPLLERTKDFLAAVEAKDAAKLAACYAEDAVLMPPNVPRLKGQKAIEDHARRLFQDSPSSELALTPLASHVSTDLAYIQGEYLTSGKRPSGQFVREKGTYVWILRNIAGEWKITHDIFNSSEPPPPPPPAPKPPKPPTPPQ